MKLDALHINLSEMVVKEEFSEDDIVALLEPLKQHRTHHRIADRLKTLKALRSFIIEQQSTFIDSLAKDLSRPRQETVICETQIVLHEVNETISKLKTWAAPRYVPVPCLLICIRNEDVKFTCKKVSHFPEMLALRRFLKEPF